MIDKIKKYHQSENKDYKLSILIPTWNNLDYLKLCIRSIKQNSRLDIQIIVFANEGKDGSLEWLKTQKDIDFLHSNENVGICYALNMCRSFVKSDYIVYVNDDMYLLPDWDTELYKEIERISTKSFMLSSTMIEHIDTGNPCVIVKNYGDSIENFKEDLLLKEYKSLEFDDWSGSTWPPNVVHVDMWDLVGGLSAEFSPGMYSDPDFSMKLYQSGVRIFKGVGSSLAYHFGSKTTTRVDKNRNGRGVFLLKWGLTPSTFNDKILHRGEPYREITKKETLSKKDRIIAKLKALSFFMNLRK